MKRTRALSGYSDHLSISNLSSSLLKSHQLSEEDRKRLTTGKLLKLELVKLCQKYDPSLQTAATDKLNKESNGEDRCHKFSKLGTTLVVVICHYLVVDEQALLSRVSRYLRARLSLSLHGTPTPGLHQRQTIEKRLTAARYTQVIVRTPQVRVLSVITNYRNINILSFPSSLRELCLHANEMPIYGIVYALRNCSQLSTLCLFCNRDISATEQQATFFASKELLFPQLRRLSLTFISSWLSSGTSTNRTELLSPLFQRLSSVSELELHTCAFDMNLLIRTILAPFFKSLTTFSIWYPIMQQYMFDFAALESLQQLTFMAIAYEQHTLKLPSKLESLTVNFEMHHATINRLPWSIRKLKFHHDGDFADSAAEVCLNSLLEPELDNVETLEIYGYHRRYDQFLRSMDAQLTGAREQLYPKLKTIIITCQPLRSLKNRKALTREETISNIRVRAKLAIQSLRASRNIRIKIQ